MLLLLDHLVEFNNSIVQLYSANIERNANSLKTILFIISSQDIIYCFICWQVQKTNPSLYTRRIGTNRRKNQWQY